MIRTRCQVCGRRKTIRTDGLIVSHYYRGDLCRGAGALPYEVDSSALAAAAEHWERESTRLIRIQLDHIQRRLNEPLGVSFFKRSADAASEAARLGGRLYRRTYGREFLA